MEARRGGACADRSVARHSAISNQENLGLVPRRSDLLALTKEGQVGQESANKTGLQALNLQGLKPTMEETSRRG